MVRKGRKGQKGGEVDEPVKTPIIATSPVSRASSLFSVKE